MIEPRLTKTRIRAGIWEGVLYSAATAPSLEVMLLEHALPGVTWQPIDGRPGDWAVRVPIPPEVLNDGVQTFLIRDKSTGETLAHFTVITGVAMEDDMR